MKRIIKNSGRINTNIVRNMCVLIVLFIATTSLKAQYIVTPEEAYAGQTYTYSYWSSTNYFPPNPVWSMSPSDAGTILSTSVSGHYTTTADIQWLKPGAVTLTLKKNGVTIGTASFTVYCDGYPAAPTYKITTPICGTSGKADLIATPPAGATGTNWYNALTGGTLLASTLEYTTPTISSSTTYYVTTVKYGCESTPRTPVTVAINSVISAPTAVSHGVICGSGAVTLSATKHSSSNSLLWHSAPTGGDIVKTGTSFTTPSLNSTLEYHVSGYDSVTKCQSATRLLVRASVYPKPMPLSVRSNYVVGSGPVQLKAFIDDYANGGKVEELSDTVRFEINWYSSPENAEAHTSRIALGTKFTTPSISATTSYYVRIEDTESGCWGEKAEVTATVTPLVVSQSIKSETLRVLGKKTDSDVNSATDAEKNTTITYIDGMGRVRQQVAQKGSPQGNDVVMPVEYDAFGRNSKTYLPYVASTTNGSFHSSYVAEQFNFYLAGSDKIADDSAAYALTVYEGTASARPTEAGGIGKAFQPGTTHTQKAEYNFNTSTDYVRKFDGRGNSTTWHGAKTLNKTKSISPDGDFTVTFTNADGQTVLIRQWIDATVEGTYTDYLETYYLYNELGQVTYILSPKGTAELKAASWSFGSTIKDSYCNQFKYDSKGRVIEKKVPGQAWQSIVYDPLGRVVLTQDGLLKAGNKWMFVKYDYKGNAMMTGIHTNTTYTTRATMQAYVDGIYVSGHASFGADTWYEKKGSTAHGYTNVSFPKDNIDVLSVNYFDNYDFDFNGSADASYTTESLTGEHTPATYTIGYATGSKRKILETSTWLYTYVFYDDRGRTIQVQTTNQLNTSSLDRVSSTFADDGRVIRTKKYHNAGTPGTTTVLNKFQYNARGDLYKVWQANNDTVHVLLVQYEYNKLGQVVDKKLHHTGSGNFLQSVDYRYTIKGQLKSINNSELSSNAANDETNDYFGMELLYNDTESGLTTGQRYDGSISAIKWKGTGAASGASGQKSYAYSYDKTGRLLNAAYVKKESSWNKETDAQNEAMTYDHNGNIKSLTRKQRKHELTGLTGSYTSETIDNLTYAYQSTDKNKLANVDDPTANTEGFKNGASLTNEYRYDANGNLTSDKNKGIDSIYYNFLGKPVRMDFSDGKKIEYVYDAGGNKLTQKLYQGATLQTTTEYVNGFVYEKAGSGSTTLSFFGSPEGRVVKNGSNLVYEYSISDHQGNTRVVFSSSASAVTFTANFESGTNTDFPNYPEVVRSSLSLFNHTTPSGTYSQKLTGASGSQVGVAKSIKVYPGDKVKIDAYAKYYNPSGTASNIAGFALALTGAFGVTSSSTGEMLKAYNTLNNYGGIIAGGGSGGSSSYPKLFVNILLFDKDYNFLDAAWEQIDGGEQIGATPTNHDLMSKEVTVKEAGYAYVFLSNENPTLVEFYVDDVVITHTPTNVIQYNEYYPFGLQTSTSWTRENTKDNNYLYNAANEMNKTSGWYEMFYRGYDPAIGRMLQVDPYAPLYASTTTYNYALNSPVMMNDPSGGQVDATGLTNSQLRGLYLASRWQSNSGDFADWASDNVTGTSLDGGYFGSMSGGRWGLFEYEYTYTDRDGEVTKWYEYQREWVNDPTDPPTYRKPTFGIHLLEAMDVIGEKLFGIKPKNRRLPSKKLQDYLQILIIGKNGGTEQFAMRKMGNGRLGIWKVGDPESSMTILDLTIAGSLHDTAAGAMGIFLEDPRNLTEDRFFAPDLVWHEMPGMKGYYYTHDPRFSNEFYYKHDYSPELGHRMVPSNIKSIWKNETGR